LQSTPKFLPVADDALLFEAEEQLWRFDLARGVYAAVPPNSSGARFRLLGVLNDQSVCVQRVVPDAPAEAPRLERLDGVQVKPLEIPPPSPTVGHLLLTVFQAQNGNLWLSGEHGVAVYRSGQWKVFTTAEASGPEGGTWFAEAADGRIWCATPEEVWRFDGRDWSLVRSGLDSINALLRARDGSVWVASNSGLHRWLNGDWVENGPAEGLPDAVVTSLWEDRRGRLWAGTSQGLCQQHPEADPDPPRTEILPPADTLIPEGGTITLSFSGQDKWKFTPRSRLLYSHRLDERDWSPFVDWSTATFSDLPPGRHFVQVRAMDRNGNIEPKPTQVIFAVALPWYREPRLLGIAGVGLAAALFFAAVALNRHLQLRRSYAEVERQVAERTRELEQRSRELLHSQKMNALGTLAAGIAHDFNNILSVIKGSAQIIEDNLNQPQKVRTRVERIQTVVEQGAGIVRAMLGFSRSSNETLEPCDLNAVLEDTITLLGDRFLRDLELRFDRASGLPQVPVVKDFAQQILLNFIFNAAESMPERKQIVLRTARLETLPPSLVLKPADAAGYVAVSVQDFGCGIPPENLSRVFEPFFTTKALSRHRGTGLGLSMAYDLAKRMHAGLAVESVVGQGSTFTLILPANAA
jgi:signal transduction histidine kinase